MNRLKLLAAATLLMVPIACGDPIDPPPPTGSIDGLVSIEGQGIDGVSVTLSNGGSAITANGGMYRFDGVEAGAYTVTISNYPDDASFNQTSAAATISTDGETVTVNFPGTYIRTSSIMGTVTVENEGLNGITVKLSGVSDSETLTDGSGQYAFTGLRAGNYTIEISGFDDEDVAFGSTSSTATLAVGESKVVSFEGTYLRTSGIVGQVTADEEPQEGITVSLQGRGENRSVTTNATGQYAFEQLRRGDYSVVISGYDTDEMTFEKTSESVTVAYGETANVPFEGILLRTAGIEGTVTVDGVGPIADVTVTIEGEGETHSDITDNMGAYSFDQLAAGDYSVSITGFDDDQYGFPDGTSATVTVELQSTGTVPFDGIMLRTAAIEGTVTVGDDDTPISATVTVTGGPKDEEHTTTTNADGEYLVDNLHAGTYSVSISGYDTNEFGFNPTTESVDVGLRETAEVAFQGDLLRTAGVSGRVHVDGMGQPGVMVKLTGEEDREMNTDDDGQYGFSGLAAGDYMLEISGWNEVEYSFDMATMEFELELDETKTGVNFKGKALRTATVMGSVTIEDDGESNPLPGIAVTLIKLTGTSGELIGTYPTNSEGGYSFGPLLAGTYQVMIDDNSADADEHDWGDAGTTQVTLVDTDGTATVNFMATIIRTAKLSGMVTVDGEAMADVEVTLTGDHAPDDNTKMTDADGMYGFDGLRKGSYTVTMTNPDADTYDFPMVEQSRNLSVGQDQGGVSFAGTRIAQASISGQVHAEGDAIPGVTVKLSGDKDAEDMTDENGEYNFPGLASGTYTVTISGWPEDAYDFAEDETTKTRTIASDAFEIVDFAGTHTKTASISGMLFLDEVNSDGELTDGEPELDLSAEIAALQEAGVIPELVTGLPLELTGPELGKKTPGMATAAGAYMFPGLRAGTYSVRVALDFEVDAEGTTVGDLLTGAGYRYSGEDANQVTVAANEQSMDNHLPFRITMQTIHVGAVMGTSKMATETMVGGVKLMLFPTVEAADIGTEAVSLGTATTGADDTKPNYGMAQFDFARAMDLGPGGQGKDHLVFAKVVASGNAALEVADNSHIEIEYDATKRVDHALTAARLLNTAVSFQWEVRSDEDARHGDQLLGGWKVVMGEETIATGDSAAADPTMRAKPEDHGKASYSGTVAIADLDDNAQAKYTVNLDMDSEDPAHDAMQPDGGEMWKPSGMLTHTHNALDLPADMADDLGAIYVTWTTQTLVVGVHREMDDVYGYAKYESVVNGDHRPSAKAGEGMRVMVMWEQGRNNRLAVYDEWDEDCDQDPDDEPSEATKSVGSSGVVKFPCLPADQKWTVRFEEGANRDLVTDLQDIETFGGDLDEGMTIGSFGDAHGAMSEVRICSASIAVVPGYDSGTTDELCSTFGYQWTTGSISGNVGAVSGLGVALEAVTDEHGQQDDTETSGTGGAYAFTGLQDGTYTVTASGNDEYAIVGAASATRDVYHDEACWANPDPDNNACSAEELDGPDADGDYTYTNAETKSWTLSRLGLEVRGYVANVSHEHNNVVRGDETAAGMQLDIRAYAGTTNQTTGQPNPTGPVISTATVQSDGSYKFENLNAGRYVIIAKNVAGQYEGLQSGPTDNIGGAATAQDYAAITDEQMLTGKLPSWDYENSAGLRVGPQTVTVGSGASAVNNIFHNFALLHADGTFSGRVMEARGDAAGIAVELRRCETYVAPDPDATPAVVEACREETAWGPQRDDASSAGNWEFPSLREGYYAVNVAAVNYLRAKVTTLASGTVFVDDDGTNCGPSSDMPEGSTDDTCDQYRTVRAIDDLRGKRAFNPGGKTFYVYNSSLRRDDVLTVLSVKGVTTPKKNPVAADHVELVTTAIDAAAAQDATGTNDVGGNVSGTVTWRGASVAVKATVSDGASYVVRASAPTATGGPSTAPVTYTPHATTGATVPLPYDGTTRGTPGTATETTITVAVTGENGYNDHMYTFAVSRAAPQDNELETADFTPNPGGGAGTTASPWTFTTADATTNTLAITINRVELGTALDAYCTQTVEVVGQTGADADSDACANETYTLTAGTTGTTYEVKMTSEDGVTTSYWINVSRGA